MKKMVTFVATVVFTACLLFANIGITFANEELVSSYPYKGIAISGIELHSFMSKYQSIPVAFNFVDDIDNLSEAINVSHAYNVGVFSKLDLFYFAYENKNVANKEDLVKYFNSLDPEDFVEKEQLFSILLSLYEEDGTPVTISKKTEPKIEITYRYESTKNGYIEIPERKVIKQDTYTTYFYLDPLKFPYTDRSSYYNFLDSYFIQPSYFLAKSASSKYRNPNLDFDGYYIPLPDVIDGNYSEVVQNVLTKLKDDLSKNDKKIAFFNVNLKNVDAVKNFGDVFVVPVTSDSLTMLKEIRNKLVSKVIVASFDGNLSNFSIEQFLRTCVLVHAIPLFNRDLSSGEFIYYENDFSKYITVVQNYLEYLQMESSLDFINEDDYNDFSVSCLSRNNVKVFVFDGSGHINYKIETSKIPLDFSYNYKGLSDLKIRKNGNFINLDFDLNGIGLVEFSKPGVYLLTTAKAPCSKNSIAVFIKNGSNKSTECSFTLSYKSSISNISFDFEPFEEKSYVIGKGESISFNGETIQNPYISTFNFLNLIIVILLLALSIFLVRVKLTFRKLLSKNSFYILILVLTVLFLFLNQKIIGYNLTTFLFLLIAIYFVIFTLYRGEVKPLSISCLFIFLGLFYNLLATGTLLPESTLGFTMQLSFEVVLFYLPLVLMIAMLLTFERKINFIELSLIFVLLLFTLFFKMTLLSAFQRSVSYSYIMFAIVLIYEFVLLLRQRLFSLNIIVLFSLSFLLTLLLPFLNNFAVSKALTFNLFYLLSYSFVLFYSLTFLILEEISEFNAEFSRNLNAIGISFVLIYGLISLVTQAGYLRLGNQSFLNLGFILQFIPIILFIIVFFEIFKPTEE